MSTRLERATIRHNEEATMQAFTLKLTPVTPNRAKLELEAASPLVEKVARVLLDPGDAQPAHQPASRARRAQPARARPKKAAAKPRRAVERSIPLTCQFCGNHFRGYHSGQKYCADHCRDKARNLSLRPRPNGPVEGTV